MKIEKLLLILVLAIALVFAFGAVALAANDSPVGANHNPLPTYTSAWDKASYGPLGLSQKATIEAIREGAFPGFTNQGKLTNWWKVYGLPGMGGGGFKQ
jgi:hypothetical protein